MSEDSEYISVKSAGKLLGVTPRTVRNWINDGKLPAIDGKRGRLIKRDDALYLGNLSGHRAETTEAENASGSASVRSSAELPETSSSLVSAYSQLEAIREEWLQPLVDRIGELEREAGRLQAERDRAMQDAEGFRKQAEMGTISHQRTKELEAERDDLRRRLEDQPVVTDDDGPISIAEAEHVRQLEQERDALERRVRELETLTSQTTPSEVTPSQERPQSSWWRRLLRLDG